MARKGQELEGFLSDIEDLKEAKRLLVKIWSEMNWYEHRSILSYELRTDLERYFGFDDSE